MGKVEHGARFTGGAAGDVQVGEQLGRGATFEAFGDVIGDGKGSAAELVGKVATARPSDLIEGGMVREKLDAHAKVDSRSPDGKVFETVVSHGVVLWIPDLR